MSQELAELPPLFPRVDKAAFLAGEESAPSVQKKDRTMITIEEFFKSELKVATVTGAEAIPKAKKLLKLEVDLGEEGKRTLVAGIAEEYEPGDLVGQQVVVVSNLQQGGGGG